MAEKKPIIGLWRWAIIRSDLSSRARLVALVLAVRMNEDGRIPKKYAVGIRRIAADTGYKNHHSILDAIGELIDRGWLEVEESGGRPEDRPWTRPNHYQARFPSADLTSTESADLTSTETVDFSSRSVDFSSRSVDEMTPPPARSSTQHGSSTGGPAPSAPDSPNHVAERREADQLIEEIVGHVEKGSIEDHQVLELGDIDQIVDLDARSIEDLQVLAERVADVVNGEVPA